ncbi:MAG TPA: iron-containing redox enzyme family protein, partial [Solirubrobacterales bacterium]|nr:iron-containing redox enzyme family protein [Solirubrobacterales bacterium]
MLRLPPPAGPISASLVDYLRGDAPSIAPLDGGHEPLSDRDFQLALYVANELHYTGVAEVPDEFEWDPAVAALRADLAQAMLDQLIAECAPEPSIEPGQVPERIFELIAEDDAPPLSRYIETSADLSQFREFVVHRSAYQLKEADPHTFTIPRVSGAAKAAMVEIQADEYGGGDLSRMHSQLFAKTMDALGLAT